MISMDVPYSKAQISASSLWGGDSKWKILKNIQLFDHPTINNTKIWNQWIWRELQLHNHAPGDVYGSGSIAGSSGDHSEEFADCEDSEDSVGSMESEDSEDSEGFSDYEDIEDSEELMEYEDSESSDREVSCE